MKKVPFYPNDADNMRCMVAVYQTIFDYFLDKKLSINEMSNFVGYAPGRAAWTVAPLTKMAALGLDIHMLEPFNYRAYEKRGVNYLHELYPGDKADWMMQ